jgi:hypothetical protein
MKNIFVILMSSIILFSCSKEENNTIQDNTNPQFKSVSIDSIGIVHNDGLDYIIKNYDNKSRNIDSIFNSINTLQKDYFLSKGYKQNELSAELIALVTSGNGISWLNDLYSSNKINISLDLKGYLVGILTYTYNGTVTPFSQVDYFNYLDTVYQNATSTLSSSELEMLAMHISVAKASFEYWFYSDGTPRIKLSGSSKAVNWWQTLGADCIGGLFGGPYGFLGASALDLFYQLI